jgi:ATP-dependent RNA circularization protein (DNA/RNA ligase family)
MWLGAGRPRDDKIMPGAEVEAFLGGPVVVEEKVDGANLGLAVGPGGRIRVQSRGNTLAPGRNHAQWNPLWPWLARHEQALVASLGEDKMLFGEWCYARHTVAYTALPDWFLAFDVLEPSTETFWSSDRRNELAAEIGLSVVPEVFRGRLTVRELSALIGRSSLGAARMEGIYLRRESEGRLIARAKLVGCEFKQQIEEHWTRRAVVANRLPPGTIRANPPSKAPL